MKHAGSDALARLQSVLVRLRAVPGLKETKPGTFYRRSSAFLHFHEDAAGLFADVKLDGKRFHRLPVNSAAEQQALLAQVHGALTAQTED
jgi:hypothetical protein